MVILGFELNQKLLREVIVVKKRLLIISLVALLLSGCLGNSISQKTYNISGWINKSEDNQPLNGVKLLVNSTTVETNAEGRFKVLGLSGTTVVTPVLNGWRFEPESIEVGGKRDDLVFMAYNPEKETLGNVKVSLIGSYGSTQTASIRPLMHDREHFPFTPEIYSKDFQNPGELVERFTPHKFIAALNGIAAHSPNRSPVRFFRTPRVR